MATQVRYPIWLPAVTGKANARTFAILYGIESFTRASIASVIPIQAYDILQSEQNVSLLYTLVALLGLSVTLSAPILIARFARRYVYTAGALALSLGSLLMLTDMLGGQILGMLARVIGTSLLAITLNLYIMDHIRKTDFVHAESTRLAWSTLAWMGGPALGVFLYTEFGLLAPHLLVIGMVLILLCFFWYYRLTENTAISAGKARPVNPLRNVRRFAEQPRLRLAWLIAFGRSCFWTTFFVYVPLLMVVSGQGQLAGGLVVSAGNGLLFSALIWGKAGQRFGLRPTLTFAFAMTTLTLIGASFTGEAWPWLTAGFLLVGTFFIIALDALGSTAFLRVVRSYERPQMTAVYRTYLDLSELTPPLIYSVVLAFTGLGGVFATLALFLAICGWLTWRYLPKSF